MSDDPNVQADETADTAQSAVDATSETPVPWGDDFNPERAWKTITHLRDLEKELEPLAKTYQRLESGEDFDTFKTLAEKYGFTVEEPEVEEFDTEETPAVDPRVQELYEWKQEQEAQRALNEFNTHVDKLAPAAELELTDRERQWILNDSLKAGFKPETTEAAFKEYAEWKKEQERAIVARYTGSKKAPHVSPVGQSATKQVDLDNAEQRQAWMLEQLRGGPAS